jgi:hypothetical protein
MYTLFFADSLPDILLALKLLPENMSLLFVHSNTTILTLPFLELKT